jgi:hypothetical protein
MLSLIIGALFLCEPSLYELPRADAYLVRHGERQYLEDRFNTEDQWFHHSLLGAWRDVEGRHFELFSISYQALPFEENKTRRQFVQSLVPIKRRDKQSRLSAIKKLLPESCLPEGRRLTMLPRSCEDFMYFECTNKTVIAAAFKLKSLDEYLFSVWEILPTDDYAEKFAEFEKYFLEKEVKLLNNLRAPKTTGLGERDLAKAYAIHSITNFNQYHATVGDDILILDDLPLGNSFMNSLTNDLQQARSRFAKVIPSPIEGSNVLALARIYFSRDDYLAAAGSNMYWSAAYWNASRRELVSSFPQGGYAELCGTLRHEAFHQYLSYATSMIPTSPWLNEGYAQFFEDESKIHWPRGISPEMIEAFSEQLPKLFRYDYGQFYAGTDEERSIKYMLAWSIAYFIENGAPKVRFNPFAKLKERYIEKLLQSCDMHSATSYSFESAENFELFISEWEKFWKKNL